MILHIPHSSIKFPNKKGFSITDAKLNKEVLKLTDWFTDELFESTKWKSIKADFSRIFCDVERFSDNEKEVMYKFGMGVLYEKSDDGKLIREVNSELREDVLNGYYWKHHKSFSKAVLDELSELDKCLIVDCHSFPNKPLKRDLDQSLNRPDYNIGIDEFHTPVELISVSKEFFKSKGYLLGIDKPYSGSIVPMEYYKKDKRVSSIMLEINRKLYLQDGTNIKSNNFDATKGVVQEYLELLNSTFYNEH